MSQSSRLCPTCQKIYSGEVEFCPRDGARLSDARILAGKFVLRRELGRGAMGVVYEALQPAMNRRVAVKVLHPERVREAAMLERFEREARAAGRIRHDHVVTVYDCGVADGVVYLAMEYLEGEGLYELLRREGPLPAERALPLWRQAVDALAEAHREKVVHRDIKPENIFIDRQRGRERVKVLDFGIARILEDSSGIRATMEGTVLGTAEYMAPEQIEGRRAEYRADVYALGLLLCEMLTGRLPWDGSGEGMAALLKRLTQPPLRLMQLAPGRLFPPALQRLLDDALALDPERRPADAGVLLLRFDALMEEKPLPWTGLTAPLPVLASLDDDGPASPGSPGPDEATLVTARARDADTTEPRIPVEVMAAGAAGAASGLAGPGGLPEHALVLAPSSGLAGRWAGALRQGGAAVRARLRRLAPVLQAGLACRGAVLRAVLQRLAPMLRVAAERLRRAARRG